MDTINTQLKIRKLKITIMNSKLNSRIRVKLNLNSITINLDSGWWVGNLPSFIVLYLMTLYMLITLKKKANYTLNYACFIASPDLLPQRWLICKASTSGCTRWTITTHLSRPRSVCTINYGDSFMDCSTLMALPMELPISWRGSTKLTMLWNLFLPPRLSWLICSIIWV